MISLKNEKTIIFFNEITSGRRWVDRGLLGWWRLRTSELIARFRCQTKSNSFFQRFRRNHVWPAMVGSLGCWDGPVLCAFAALPRACIWAGAYAPAPALGDFRPALAGGFHPALVALPPATVPPATIWTALKLCTAVAARITPTPMYQK